MATRPGKLTWILTASALFAAVVPAARADEVTRWNQIATRTTAAAHADPLTESRTFAMMHVAIHDALNGVEPRYERYLASPASYRGGSPEAAVATAAHDTLVALMPSGKAAFDAALDESLRGISEKDRGIAAGRAAASAVLAKRASDGSAKSVAIAAGSKPGAYRPTPPALIPAWAGQWGDVTPFVLRSSAQFRPGAPPAVDGDLARSDVADVRSVGAKDGSTRTDEQSEIARFWYENSTQGWNRIARNVTEARKLDLHENARLFALLNLALADGYIAVFDAKYHYGYWRPVTAIRESGASDWLSYLDTPPIPDYPSGHTVEGAAAASVLAHFFGTDFVSFKMESGDPYPGITRGFWSFSEAARENGASRVFAGIHFPTAVATGYVQGDEVGTYVYEHALKPLSAQVVAAAR